MIVNEAFLKKIRDFGLNSYEAKIWAALLSRGVSTAGELSDIANVPRSRSYDVLESLEKKGFIIMKLGKPIKYIAVPPEEVLRRVQKKITDSAEKTVKSMDELKSSEILKELSLLYSQGIETVEPADLSGSIKGRDNVYEHLNMLLKKAKQSVIIVTSEAGLARKDQALGRNLRKAAERGVKIRIAAPKAKVSDKLKKIAEVRAIDDIKARFMIVDGREMTFMLTDDEKTHPSYDVGVWFQAPMFVKAQEQLFNKVWK
jgi:sugar-specific transcriptional regulator TrmB